MRPGAAAPPRRGGGGGRGAARKSFPSGWSRPAAVPGYTAAASPTVRAGSPGRIAVAFFATRLPRAGSDANPYAAWYPAVATSLNASGDHPVFGVHLAT